MRRKMKNIKKPKRIFLPLTSKEVRLENFDKSARTTKKHASEN
jgi:hypothetical protein